MKMLFIYPDLGGNITFSPAIEVLSACLKADGNDVELIHLNEKHAIPFDHNEIFSRVMDINPDIIGLTATTFQYDWSSEIAKNLKERGVKQLIILGGIHATIAPYDLKDSFFDAFAIGEGERTVVELFRRLKNDEDIYSVKGINFKKDNEIICNGAPNVISDLDELPPRDFEIMNLEKILSLRNNWFSTSFSRGCLFNCSFCINAKLREQYKNSCESNYYRCQSVDRVMSELMPIIEKYKDNIDVIDLDDDLLLSNKKWFSEFASRFSSEIYKPYGIKYCINARADFIDEDIVINLKKSGCELIQIGFETGSEDLRNNILKKGISDAQLIKAFDLFNKYELRSMALAMIGIPGESLESIEQSMKVLRRLKPSLIREAIFQPFIGTPLYDYCEKNNLFNGNKTSSNCYTTSTLKFDDISQLKFKQYQLLYPWYLNLNFVGKHEEKYIQLINKYSTKSEEELLLPETRNSILVDDKKISDLLTRDGIQHFYYFEDNSFYIAFKNL